jgi:hypothetical protein
MNEGTREPTEYCPAATSKASGLMEFLVISPMAGLTTPLA